MAIKRKVVVKKRRQQAADTGGTDPDVIKVRAADRNGVADFLSHFGLSKLRFNELRQDVEVKPEKDIEGWKLKRGVWQPLDKEDGIVLDSMLVKARADGRRFPKNPSKFEDPAEWPKFGIVQWEFRASIVSLAMDRNRHNAWTKFIKPLKPARDKKGRLDDSFLATAFKECFDIPKTWMNSKGELNDYYMDALKLHFVTMLKRQKAIRKMDEQGYHCRVSLLLRGPPGAGKSSFFGESFPKSVGRSLFLEKLNIEESWPDPEGRRTLGKACCHTPEFHKYFPKVVQNWVSSHDLAVDTMKVLYKQRMAQVIRGWSHTFSANANDTLANVEAMNSRLAILDVLMKTSGEAEVQSAAERFFEVEGNVKKLFEAALAAEKKGFEPKRWDALGYKQIQNNQVEATAYVHNETIQEWLRKNLDENTAYKVKAVREAAIAVTGEKADDKFMGKCLAGEQWEAKRTNEAGDRWWIKRGKDVDALVSSGKTVVDATELVPVEKLAKARDDGYGGWAGK